MIQESLAQITYFLSELLIFFVLYGTIVELCNIIANMYKKKEFLIMKKRLFIMIAMLFAIVPLAACGENLDALELLERSHEAQADYESMIMELDADISVSMPGMSLDMPMTMRIEMENEETFRMDMTISALGMDVDALMFLRDGYMYSEIDMFGEVERMREEMDMSEAMEMAEMAEMFDIDFITENTIEESSAESTDDGYRLEFSLNMEGVMTFLETMDLMDDIDMPDFDDLDEDEIEEWNVVMIMYIDEDYLPISAELTMEFDMTVEGTNVSMEMDMTMTTVQLGDVTIDFPDWLDEMDINFEDSELLGYWEQGDGQVFLWVFNQADSVEFLVDGTLIITENGQRTVVEWEPTEPGAFTADGDSFTYLIARDILTITDSSNDSWSFYREGTAPIIEEVEDEEDEEVDEDEDEDEDEEDEDEDEDETATGSNETALIGEWNFIGTLWWTFNADGTGYLEGIGDFTWTTSGNVVTVTVWDGLSSLSYEYTITGNTLHLYGVDHPWDFEYTRR